MRPWMVYGAYGYSGALIARQAAAEGLRPVLAGRDAGRVSALAGELGLDHRVFAAGEPDLAGIGLVLNCAGPFSRTARPMMQAALAAGAHYLDITGEIEVFEQAALLDAPAKAAGVVICSGVGFDVIPTDCIALRLAQAMPDATRLCLGFETKSSLSPGTAKTTIANLGRGTRIRRGGRLRREPLGWRARTVDFGRGPRKAIAFPWGDVSTAWTTTGIGDITVYVPVPARLRWGALLSAPLSPLLRLDKVQQRLMKRAATIAGPDAQRREATPAWVWGEVRNAAGDIRTARIRTANSYDVTVNGALAVVRHLRDTALLRAGHLTPSLLCGAGLIESLPGSGTMLMD